MELINNKSLQNESEIIKLAKNGDDCAINKIMTTYKPLVNLIARRYFLINNSFEDLIQEGMIGLFKAYNSFDLSCNASFKSYASLCINRQILTAIKANNRNKNLPINTYFSINNQGKILLSIKNDDRDDDDDENGFYIHSSGLSPEESIIFKEKLIEINLKINKLLSIYEKKVLAMYISGFNYISIAKKLKKEAKSIDNALSRIKIKLKDLKCI